MSVLARAGAGDPGLSWLLDRAGVCGPERARAENFPVASRALPAAVRRDLMAVYSVARLIDDTADAAPGDRGALLDVLESDLRRLPLGRPHLPPIQALVPAVRARGLPIEPFLDLVQAGRMDQTVTRYADLAALREYCRLSAQPVGRLVLTVWGLADPGRLRLSDDLCTGLQVAEHLQDVGEDLAGGRIYLPQDAMLRHGVDEPLLAALSTAAGPPVPADGRRRVQALLAEVAGQARDLLDSGAPLVRQVPGRARVAVAGFLAGGYAALDAVLAAGAGAVAASPRPRRGRLLRHAVRAWSGWGPP